MSEIRTLQSPPSVNGKGPLKAFGDGAISGAAVMTAAKLAGYAVSFVSVMIIARILRPSDFGLVAMAMSLVAFFIVFSDFGLTLVTVQRPNLSAEQLNALFWANLAFGFGLAVLNALLAPILTWFYEEPRVLLICLVLSSFFVLAALGAQQQALLKRDMRFRRLAVVRFVGGTAGPLVAIALALSGAGYWSLAAQMLVTAAVTTFAAWIAIAWRPGLPRGCEDFRSMLGFGGALTGHGVVGYFANNMDTVLLGKMAGSAALGIYSTSYQLMMRPIALAAYGVGETAIPAMSRAPDAQMQRATFRRMFSLTCLLGLPICVAGVWWADDIVWTLLGSQWVDAIPVLQALFVAAAARMLLAPTGWVYVATARPGRMLGWQIIFTPLVVAAFAVGAFNGAFGVAVAYAVALWISFIPGLLFCFRGTEFSVFDVLGETPKPLLCALAATALAVLVQEMIWPGAGAGVLRLSLRTAIAILLYLLLTPFFVPLASECFREGFYRTRACLSGFRGPALTAAP